MVPQRTLAVRLGGLALCSALAAAVGSAVATHDSVAALRVGVSFAVAAGAVVGVIGLAALPFRRRTRVADPVAAADGGGV